MSDFTNPQPAITDPFWAQRQRVNARQAILHQWRQLESAGCIDNFRLVAGDRDGFRTGWFFADSDAYKWLDAASRIYARHRDPGLASLMDAFIELLARAQSADGYLFTYNQLHFPGQRWVNLQIEHELYCHGHFIEAGVSHHEATGRRDLLDLVIRAADFLVRVFLNASPASTCGHEEIEIALIRLHRLTGTAEYLELARRFVERRGRIPFFPLHMWHQLAGYRLRRARVEELRQAYAAQHPHYAAPRLPGGNYTRRHRFSRAQWYLSALSGRYAQQYAPIRMQTSPEGHAVRFGYLEAAIAMLLRNKPDDALLGALEQAWERMVTRRMYITGGLGSVPGFEGFGRDYELDPDYAYAETCAAIASLLWNREMALLTGQARYSDLLEWQLYNAVNVGMGLGGDSYLYNNPLRVHAGVTRRAWFAVPCCPSNLSRTLADVGQYIHSAREDALWIHQYIGSEFTVDLGPRVDVRIDSGLPWTGRVQIHIRPENRAAFKVHVRRPSWSTHADNSTTASGYDPRIATFETVERIWSSDGDTLEFDFDTSIQLRRAHPKVKGHAGKFALTRGPLVYCLESIDNPDVNIFSARLDPSSLRDEYVSDLLGGCVVIHARTTDGAPLIFIPYFLWANRGESQMTVWVNSS